MAKLESLLVHAMSKIFVFFLFKDGADLRMESFSCKQSLHTSSPGANCFTFLFFNYQTRSPSVVEVLLCSNLKDDVCKLNLVVNSFSVCPIYVSWLFKVASVTFLVWFGCFPFPLPRYLFRDWFLSTRPVLHRISFSNLVCSHFVFQRWEENQNMK